MRRIPLLSSVIDVGCGLLKDAGARIRELEPRAKKAFLLTDRNCARYARTVRSGLQAAGMEVEILAIAPGESQKKPASAARIYDRLARAGIERQSAFVAVGGGVVTDLGAFAASTWMRGIPLFLVPTTLLAQVDAAIGGKTGVNLPQGKNLVGTFYQPLGVFCDPEVFRTLPAREYVGGLGEVVKYGVIRDAELFPFLEKNIEAIRERKPDTLEEIVFRCASIKADVVSKDEKESGLRAILNYGHTIGHGLEAAGGYRKLHHGEAVSVGMEAAAVIAMDMGLTPLETLAAQNRLLKLCGLPTRVKGLPPRKVLEAMRLDKKNSDGRFRFVLPEAVGRVRFGVEVPAELVVSGLRAVSV
jgi:3-dehydroquinate synthase